MDAKKILRLFGRNLKKYPLTNEGNIAWWNWKIKLLKRHIEQNIDEKARYQTKIDKLLL